MSLTLRTIIASRQAGLHALADARHAYALYYIVPPTLHATVPYAQVSPGFCILLQSFYSHLRSEYESWPWPLARAKQGYLVCARAILASYSQAEPGHL